MDNTALTDVSLMPWEQQGFKAAVETEGDDPRKAESPRQKTRTVKQSAEDQDDAEGTADDDDTATADADESDESGEEEADDDEDQDTDEIAIEIDGRRWTPDLIRKGVLFEADYTKKTQQLAEQKKAFEAERVAVNQQRQQYAAYLDQLGKVMEAASPKVPELKDFDTPEKFMSAALAHQENEKKLNQVRAEQERVWKDQKAEGERQFTARMSEARALLLEAIPEWKDEKVGNTERGKVWSYLTGFGYEPDQLNNIADHRPYVLARKAMLYDELMAGKEKLVQKTKDVKVLKPGTSHVNTQASGVGKKEIARLEARLKQTGDLDDAVALRVARSQYAQRFSRKRAG